VEKLEKILEEILGESYATISSVDHFREIERWDSLQFLRLVLGLQQDFSVEFSPEEIVGLTSVAAIKSALEAKVVQP
jgi:acyl carrier protein